MFILSVEEDFIQLKVHVMQIAGLIKNYYITVFVHDL